MDQYSEISIKNGHIFTLLFKNGYTVEIDIGAGVESSNKDSDLSYLNSPANSIGVHAVNGEVSIYYKDMDVTDKMEMRDIIKRRGYVSPDIFIKISNIIRNLNERIVKTDRDNYIMSQKLKLMNDSTVKNAWLFMLHSGFDDAEYYDEENGITNDIWFDALFSEIEKRKINVNI